ncbi:transcriptional regulator family: Fungal Specific TF [Purpureocillium lilacinum]|uniref:Transcriptional regulator family: Fungal Specific TF n=1 Tax=Purpureocillium lilacinum TaxID=33203 RepID=A0ABR0BFN4_PURLI|nr:transcriptional regulator family: Fungal Specific TF [Purpureocillium lilacinum]
MDLRTRTFVQQQQNAIEETHTEWSTCKTSPAVREREFNAYLERTTTGGTNMETRSMRCRSAITHVVSPTTFAECYQLVQLIPLTFSLTPGSHTLLVAKWSGVSGVMCKFKSPQQVFELANFRGVLAWGALRTHRREAAARPPAYGFEQIHTNQALRHNNRRSRSILQWEQHSLTNQCGHTYCGGMENDGNDRTASGTDGPGSSTATGSSRSESSSAQAQPSQATTPFTQSSTRSTYHPQSSKRSRALGTVTPNACKECRKKRAKCDGNKPCGRCKSQQGVQCVYEVQVRRSKEDLREELDTLRQRQRSADSVISGLLMPNFWGEILDRLRNEQPISQISEWLHQRLPPTGGPPSDALPILESGDDGQDRLGQGVAAMDAAGDADPVGVATPAVHIKLDQRSYYLSHGQPHSRANHINKVVGVGGTTLRPRALEQLQLDVKDWESNHVAKTWTTVTSDVNLVAHLLALYFCWEYPTFASLSKEHFLRDFWDGRRRYCSPVLVNALLALGCRFSDRLETRRESSRAHSAGNHFFKEAQRLLQENDHSSITTVQALGIMSIREAGCGRDSDSRYYAGQSMRLALELGLHRVQHANDEGEDTVRSATFWGAFALDHAWSLATGSLPQLSSLPQLPPKPALVKDIEVSPWIPYTEDGIAPQLSHEQPSNVRSVYQCFCELSELVHQSLYLLHSPVNSAAARDLLTTYTHYLRWYDQIPDVLRLGRNYTPAVLFTHMYYHFAILLLFRASIALRIVGSAVSPKDVCLQAADAILGLVSSYSQLYTLKRTPAFVPYIVLAATIVHLHIVAFEVNKPPGPMRSETGLQASEKLKRGFATLAEMAACHQFAQQATNILRHLAQRYSVELGDDEYGNVDIRDHAVTVRPYDASLDFLAFDMVPKDCANPLVDNETVSVRTELPAESRKANSVSTVILPIVAQTKRTLPNGKELDNTDFSSL